MMASPTVAAHNRRMLLVEAAFVTLLAGAVIYAITALLLRPPDQCRPPAGSGSWRVAHYDVGGETRVVLQRVSGSGTRVLDEHVVATVRCDDPEYDQRFLDAMSIARQRQALFDTEDGTS